ALSFNQTAYAAEYGRIEDSEDPESPRRGCFRRISQFCSAPCTNVTLAADSVAVEGLSLLYAARFIGEDRREYMLRDYLAAGMIIGLPCLAKAWIHFDRFKALPSEVEEGVRRVREANTLANATASAVDSLFPEASEARRATVVRDTYDKAHYKSFLNTGTYFNAIFNQVIPVLFLALIGRGDIPLPVSAIMSLPLGVSNSYKSIKTVEPGEGGAFVFEGELSPGYLFSETAKGVLRMWYALPQACFMALVVYNMLPDFKDRTSLSAMVGVLSFGLKVACDSRKPVAGLERVMRGLPRDACGRIGYVADLTGRTLISTLPTVLLYTMGAEKMGMVDLSSPYAYFEATMAAGLVFSLTVEEGFALLPTPRDEEARRIWR
ncbi:MAG: hypothetical protein K0R52_1601, partial [Alphaproteobacteria bacterium]|nr:hypothetical protein [Alphaproteobacteria bacterium]